MCRVLSYDRLLKIKPIDRLKGVAEYDTQIKMIGLFFFPRFGGETINSNKRTCIHGGCLCNLLNTFIIFFVCRIYRYIYVPFLRKNNFVADCLVNYVESCMWVKNGFKLLIFENWKVNFFVEGIK